MQVGAHVVRLGRRGVVHVATDVAVVVLRHDLGHRHAASVGGNVLPRAVGVHDFVDVFRAQVVLRLAFAVFAVGVDEEHMLALGGAGLVEHQYAGRDAGAVKQVAGQADHGFELAVVDEVFAGLALFTATEQHAVRHHRGQPPVGLEHGQHVLHEHQVGLLAFLGHPHREAAGEDHVFLDVVLAERRVGQHAVEAAQFVLLGLVLRLAQGVLLADVGVRDAVQQHVHLADGPGGAHLFLAKQRQLGRIGAVFAQVVARLDQHAARPNCWVVHAHAFARVADFHADAHDFSRGVELAGLLAGRVGEVFDQPLVGGTQQVGEFKVFVAQWDFVEVLDEIDQGVVVQRGLADLAVEVDGALEHVLQGVGVFVFQGFQRLVEHGADVFLDVLERRVVGGLQLAVFVDGVVGPGRVPAGALGHEEVLARILVGVFELLVGVGLGQAGGLGFLADLCLALVKQVAGALEEQDAEDVFLVLAGVHVAAQRVAGGHQQGL